MKRCILARRLPLLCLTVFALGAGASSERATEHALPSPGSSEWKPLIFPRIDRQTQYTPLPDGDPEGVRAEADCSASAIFYPLNDFDLKQMPRLRWRWAIHKGLELKDETQKDSDDFAARVYVAFRFDEERAGFWEKARRRAAEVIYGSELPGKTLNYVWSSHQAIGTRWTSPYTENAVLIAQGSGAKSDWQTVEVDPIADYKQAFQSDPPPLLFVALMSDSDNSCRKGSASFADFAFLPAEIGPQGETAP